MNLSLMESGQEKTVIDVVREVFDKHVAPEYTQEGVDEFYKFANEKSLAERSKVNFFTVIAYHNETAVGVIEIKEFNHISLFFVKSNFQGKGIGKALLNEALAEIRKEHVITVLTVKSAPNAISIYEALGFFKQGEEQTLNGIRFLPMQLKIR